MLNYRKMREDFKKFDVNLKRFTQTVQWAERQQATRYLKTIFPDDNDWAEVIKSAEPDIAVMSYDEIHQLACDYEMGYELQYDARKYEASSAECWEDARLRSNF